MKQQTNPKVHVAFMAPQIDGKEPKIIFGIIVNETVENLCVKEKTNYHVIKRDEILCIESPKSSKIISKFFTRSNLL
jgi:hypothetical protein